MARHCLLSNNLRHTIGVLSITSLMTFSLNTYAKQSVFLDANGQPIPDEILLQLSSGNTRAEKKETVSIENTKNTELAVPSNKKNKRRSDPALEEELFHALKAGQTQRVNQLLKIGTAATYKNYKGETPLGIAVSRGWASMVIKLIENGARCKRRRGKRGYIAACCKRTWNDRCRKTFSKIWLKPW